ncbi:MAG: hypothetical protein LBG81_07720 [Coriobacteriaceae bacterium]|jgi:lipopolysaccharide export LptBFGC system permease protein LptF|nr:hypothetical protein [Coriobacteriaceae bacterium]
MVKYQNSVATALKGLAVIAWLIALIFIALCFAVYNPRTGSEGVFMLLPYPCMAAIFGLLLFAVGEIVALLQKILFTVSQPAAVNDSN